MMLISIGTETRKDLKIIKKWKLNNKEGWRNYNKEFQEKFKKDKDRQVDLTGLIIKTIKEQVGQVRIKIGNHKTKETTEIKQIRKEKKERKTIYEESLKKK